jgi:biopolymer transport protein ExbD
MAGGGGGGDEFEVSINLTALLDVLTNLLFFLMVGMAAQQVAFDEAGIQLPSSSMESTPKRDTAVILGRTELRIAGKMIAAVRKDKIDAKRDADGHIIPLYRELVSLREKRSPNAEDADVLMVYCDQATPYSLLREVMTTAAGAGFAKFRMAVVME